MRFLKMFLGVWLILAVGACGSIQESYELLSFQPDPNSGLKKQKTEVLFISKNKDGGKGTGRRFEGADVRDVYDAFPQVRSEIQYCNNTAGSPPELFQPPSQKFIAEIAVAGPLISAAVSAAYLYVQDSISTRAKRIAKASVATTTLRFAFKEELADRWRNVRCVIVRRYEEGSEKTGLLLMFRKEEYGEASVLVPRIAIANNSVALTRKGTSEKPAFIKVGVGLAIQAVRYNARTRRHGIVDVGAIAMDSGALELGKLITNGCVVVKGKPLCANSSALIANPPSNATALAIAVNVVETGSSANAGKLAKTANDALKGIAKPLLDDIVDAVTSELEG